MSGIVSKHFNRPLRCGWADLEMALRTSNTDAHASPHSLIAFTVLYYEQQPLELLGGHTDAASFIPSVSGIIQMLA